MKITRSQLTRIIREEVSKLHEGEVVNIFSPEKSAVLSIAIALANRAANMLDNRAANMLDLDGEENNVDLDGEENNVDLDGEENNVEVHVDHKHFLSPYIDFDGHGKLVRPLANHIYNSYVLGMAGDHDEKLADIISRIDEDYLDEDIEYVLEALGDDRFTMPHTYSHDEDQQLKTKDIAAQQDPEDAAGPALDFNRYLQGIKSGKVADVDSEEV
jgi:hypothetical protein